MPDESTAPVASGGGGGGGRRGDPIGRLILLAGVGGAGYFGYRFYQREKLKAVLLAEAERLQKSGMSTKDALINAAAGACTAAAATYKIPASAAGPMCTGAAVVAMKAAQLTAKGAVIAGKVIGKGATIAAKGVAKGATVVGKGVAKGTVAVAYKAPKAVIGGSINKTDKVLSAAASKIVPKALIRVIPKPVKKVAKVAKKVVKKALCLGIFCGLDGIDSYEMALADAAPVRNPLARVRFKAPPAPANPFRAHARGRLSPSAGRSRVRRGKAPGPSGAAYYATLFGA